MTFKKMIRWLNFKALKKAKADVKRIKASLK